jgi:CubicO group peptidase (beta-lactamase class C family)
MSFIFFYFLFLLLSIFKSKNNIIIDDEMKKRLEKFVESQRILAKMDTIGLIITNKEKPLFEKIFSDEAGKATPQTPFVIGSISKSFTALSFLKLENSKELMTKTLSEFNLKDYLDEELLKDITVGELLNHTSGLDSFSSSRVSQKGQYSYSNYGFALLGKIIEQKGSMPYKEYVKKNIFEPLEMQNTNTEFNENIIESYDNFFGGRCKYTSLESKYKEKDGFYIPAGYISSSIEDMGKYIIYYLGDGEKYFSEMKKTTIEIRDNMYYGMGIVMTNKSDYEIYHHNGGTTSFLSDLYIIPKEELGFFLVTNTNDNLVLQPAYQLMDAVKNFILYNVTEMYEGVDGSVFFYLHFIYDFLFIIMLTIPLAYLIITIVRKFKRKKYTWFDGVKGKIIFGVDVLVLAILPMIILIVCFGPDGMLKEICTSVRDIFVTIIVFCVLLFLNLIVKIGYVILYKKLNWSDINIGNVKATGGDSLYSGSEED